MTERYTIFSEAGDEYRLQFTTDRSNIIADRILDLLQQDGIEVVEVGLGRVGSTNVTSHRVLQQIEESIADFMMRNPNAILSYMCDFINLVPSNKKMTVQEYRSRMFSAMFKRYMSQHHIADIFDDEIKIDGVAETLSHAYLRMPVAISSNLSPSGSLMKRCVLSLSCRTMNQSPATA